ncbi:MAG: class I SAM-dependent methyltransferase [Ignavibacteria bacterium]
MNLNSVQRFSNRVENYIKYRPHYPKVIIDFLNEETGLDPKKIVADIGSGPGISSEHFIENGNTVFAVEPNEKMRRGAEKIFEGSENFISIKGTAEDTTLQSNTIDLILAGQAFHWFDKEKCRIEFKRILKDYGYVVLMWNLRDRKSSFMEEYEDLLIRYGTEYENLYQDDVDSKEIARFFLPSVNKIKKFPNYQLLDYSELEGRLLSSSYIPLNENPTYYKMICELKTIFEKNKKDGKVKMEYETNLYYGKLT